MNETEMQVKKQRMVTIGKFVLFLVTGFVIAPFIFLAIKGLLGLLVAGMVGLVVLNAAPVLIDKLANWRLKKIKAEAAKNPVETLQLDFGKREAALGRFREAINSFSAAVMNFSDKLKGFKNMFPADADKFDGQLQKMQKLLDVRRKRYKDAEGMLHKYSLEISRAQAIWEMGLEAAKMNEAAGMTDEDFMQKIKVETALDSVTTSMNTAFAELETSLIEEEGEKEVLKLENQPVAGLPIPLNQRQKAKA